MRVFLMIVIGLPVLDAVWWYWADAQLRRLRRPRRWRIALAAFVVCNVAIYGYIILSRMMEFPEKVPPPLLGVCYIWHLLVMPLTIFGLAVVTVARLIMLGGMWTIRRLHARCTPPPTETPNETAAHRSTRREVLGAAATALPIAATALGQITAMTQLDTFRIRRLTLRLPTLPPALDGLTIAHVSDLHVGRFTTGPILDELVARTTALGADLVVFTGDLIDHALADLPAGLNVLRRIAPPERLCVCEGNHDLFESRSEFERRVRRAGVPLLVNESAIRTIRGRRVQLLGLRWGGRGTALNQEMDSVLPLLEPGTFPILLAHHPHVFDRAAEAGIALTLAGHTHGGQFMLTREIGAGSLLFKYWSGAYRHGPAALVVSNGVGNWFPLRINAPAEVIHLTLRTECAES